MHAGEHLKLPLGQPWTEFIWLFPGVACFFVISGFLVTDSALRSRTIGSFFWKRGLRIYPALIANIAVLELTVWLTGQLPGIEYPLHYFWTMLIYIATASTTIALYFTKAPALYSSGFLPSYPSGVLWTLTIELSFYLVVPIIAAAAAKSARLIFILLPLFLAGSAYYASYFTPEFITHHPILDVLCPQYLWIFGIGISVRLLWNQVSRLLEKTGWIWLPCYIVLSLYGAQREWFPLGVDFHTSISPITIVRVTFLGLTVLSCAYTCKTASSWLKGTDLSYGIYLWHMLFVTIFLANGFTHSLWLWPAVVACTLGAASLSWFCIERPALKLKSFSMAANWPELTEPSTIFSAQRERPTKTAD